jgi:ABC-type nitrate/sulfonate/bicarbonate transport system substrate-binding protein
MLNPTRRAFLAAGGVAIVLSSLDGSARHASAQSPVKLKVMVFPGLTNFTLFAAQHKGLFDQQRLEIELLNTPNSTVQRSGLIKGEHQIIHSAADNAVAMVELAKADAVITMGGDNGLNRVIAQPEIESIADLRGKTVVVDAPNTAFALLLYKVLKNAGLNKGDYAVKPVGGTPLRLKAMMEDKTNAAGVMNPPLSFRAVSSGLKDMGSAAQAIGSYQSDCMIVMRDWAESNSDTMVRYIKAFVGGRRWVLDPANRAEAIKLLSDRLKISPEIATLSYAAAVDRSDGIAKDAAFDMEGFKNVLKLRAEIEGQWGGKAPEPDKYFDLSYYNKAIAGL